MSHLTQLKAQVEGILKDHPKTRDNDRYLFSVYCYLYHKDLLKFIEGEWIMPLKNFVKTANPYNVTRMRQKIQEENNYLPTTWEVAKKRKINQEIWETYILFNN